MAAKDMTATGLIVDMEPENAEPVAWIEPKDIARIAMSDENSIFVAAVAGCEAWNMTMPLFKHRQPVTGHEPMDELWCVVSASGDVETRGSEDAARYCAQLWDEQYKHSAPHRVAQLYEVEPRTPMPAKGNPIKITRTETSLFSDFTDGAVTFRVYLSPDCEDDPEFLSVIRAWEKDGADVCMKFRFSITGCVDDVIDYHRYENTAGNVMDDDEKPMIDALRAELAAAIARLDGIRFEATGEESGSADR